MCDGGGVSAEGCRLLDSPVRWFIRRSRFVRATRPPSADGIEPKMVFGEHSTSTGGWVGWAWKVLTKISEFSVTVVPTDGYVSMIMIS